MLFGEGCASIKGGGSYMHSGKLQLRCMIASSLNSGLSSLRDDAITHAAHRCRCMPSRAAPIEAKGRTFWIFLYSICSRFVQAFPTISRQQCPGDAAGGAQTAPRTLGTRISREEISQSASGPTYSISAEFRSRPGSVRRRFDNGTLTSVSVSGQCNISFEGARMACELVALSVKQQSDERKKLFK